MPLETYLKRGLLKRQGANFTQIEANLFVYESDPFGTMTEAEQALETAAQLVRLLEAAIKREHPQLHFAFQEAPRHH